MRYEVLVVDDHPLFRAALAGAVAGACSDCEFLEADCVASLFDTLEQHPRTDLVLLDLNLPGAYGFCALAHLRGSRPELPIIVVSATDDPRTIRQALLFGAQGFISKSAGADTIGRDVQAVLRGETVTPPGCEANPTSESDAAALDLAQRMAQLTAQQFRVFGMLCLGRLNKHIAYELQITEATVKAHMTAIMRKLGAANRTQAVLLAGHLLLEPQQLKVPLEESDWESGG
jgi:DNA-binding NarL/FixJ family response regulator